MRTAQAAFGSVHSLHADNVAHVIEGQAELRHLVRIEPDAHRGALLAMKVDESHARHLRDLLGDEVLGIPVDLRERQRVGGQRERENGVVGGIDLMICRGVGKALRQQPAGCVDGGLDVLRCAIDGASKVELQRDLGAAE